MRRVFGQKLFTRACITVRLVSITLPEFRLGSKNFLLILAWGLVVSTSAFARDVKSDKQTSSKNETATENNNSFFNDSNQAALNVKASEENEGFDEDGAETNVEANNAESADNAGDNNVNANNAAEKNGNAKTPPVPKGPFDDKPMTHPLAPTYWRTRELLINSGITDYAPLTKCHDDVAKLAEKSLNQAALLSAMGFLYETMKQHPSLYHWCFYYSMMQIDLRLDSDLINRSYFEKYNYYIKEMKVMWILARALDHATQSKKYFGFLRRRYIEISKEHFGKQLDVMDAPLGDKTLGLPALKPKAAGD